MAGIYLERFIQRAMRPNITTIEGSYYTSWMDVLVLGHY